MVAVDNSLEMLEHIRVAETVLTDIFTLDLGRRFDAVIAGSHLINAPEQSRRMELLAVGRRHVKSDGIVPIERYPPGWVTSPKASSGSIGRVRIDFEPVDVAPDHFRGRVTYRLEPETWTQEFDAAEVTDQMLTAESAAMGLRVVDWLDEARTWGRLEPAG